MYVRKGERREEKRTRERKTEKICELGVFGGTSNFNIIIKPRLYRNLISCEYTRIFEFGWIWEHSVVPPRMGKNS